MIQSLHWTQTRCSVMSHPRLIELMNLISRHGTEGEIRFKILQLHFTPVHVHHTESELFILLPEVFLIDTTKFVLTSSQ